MPAKAAELGGLTTKQKVPFVLRTFESLPAVFVPSGHAAETPQGHVPYLRLTDEEARAVYQALGEYFGTQVSDNRLLRADYEAERARVDKFIDTLTR